VTEGDRQAPEGFYDITPGLMNAHSNYYLAFNTGFPNKFDRAYGRTGANLMVHGDCSSSGCYAMSDKEIAELFSLVRETLAGGSKAVQLEIFPFRMTPANLARVAGNSNMAFWKNIKAGYDAFELTKKPPSWDVCNKHYVFDASGPDGKPLDAIAACPALRTDPTLTAELSAKIAADNAAFAAVAPAAGTTDALQTALDRKAADEKAAMGSETASPAAAAATPVATPKKVAPLPAPQRT
jgi:murein L,D-transpeptidase YafK